MVEPVDSPGSEASAHPVRANTAMSAAAMGEIARAAIALELVRPCAPERPMAFALFRILTFCFSFFILSDGLKKTPGLLGRALVLGGSRNAS
jgi:hypothetical protein